MVYCVKAIFYLVFSLIFIQFCLRIFHRFLFQFLRQFLHGKPREPAQHKLLQSVVNKFVLVLVWAQIQIFNIKQLKLSISSHKYNNDDNNNTLVACTAYQCLDHSFSGLPKRFQVTEHVKTVFFLGQLQIGIDGQVNARTTATVTVEKNEESRELAHRTCAV